MENALINFKNLTKIDLVSYFDECQTFFNNGYVKMADYYNGKVDYVDTIYPKQLQKLLKQAETINEQFKTNKQKFSTVDYWELLDFCDDVRTKLQTTLKLPKYLRSSRTDFAFANGFHFDYKTGNQQTLENISDSILGDYDPENDWVDIALQNDLMETEYNVEESNDLKLYREKFVGNFVTGIIDVISGETIYGMDLYKKITIEDEDLLVLNYKQTAFQSVEILAGLKQGDIPEFKILGVASGMFVGSNLAGIAYSSIVRDMKRTFSSDDLYTNFKVIEMKQQQDALMINFSVETKYGLLIEQTSLI